MKFLRIETLLAVISLGWGLPAWGGDDSSGSEKSFSMSATDESVEGQERGEAPVYNFKQPPPPRRWPKTLMWTSFGIGVPSLLAGLGCTIGALSVHNDAANRTADQIKQDNNKIDNLNIASAVLYSVGGVFLVTALGMLWWYDGVPVENVKVAVGPQGASLAWSVRF